MIAVYSEPLKCGTLWQLRQYAEQLTGRKHYLDEGRKAACAAGNLQALHADAARGLAAHVVVQRHQRLPLHCVLLPQE